MKAKVINTVEVKEVGTINISCVQRKNERSKVVYIWVLI